MPIHCEFDITQRTLNFPRPFVDRPRLAHGIRELDIGNDAGIRVTSTLQHLTMNSADCHITTWADTTLYSAVADVIALAMCSPWDKNNTTKHNFFGAIRIHMKSAIIFFFGLFPFYRSDVDLRRHGWDKQPEDCLKHLAKGECDAALVC